MAADRGESPEMERREKILPWLLKCYQNFYVAVPPVPPSSDLPGWAEGIAAARFPLDYEPRSLAVSSDGPMVAVGTKAGTLHLASWDGAGWRVRRCASRSHAIRGVSVLDAHTVAAGWGEGCFLVFEIDDAGEPVGKEIKLHAVMDGPAWARRFSRIVRLYPVGSRPTAGDLALGLSLGPRLYVLSGSGNGGYEARSGAPTELLSGWQDEWGRLVDGGWCHGLLWLLAAAGGIACYRPEPRPQPGLLPLACLSYSHFQVPSFRRSTSLRGLDGCVRGLAVLAQDAVTFLRFKREQPDVAGPPIVDTARVRWFPVPGAEDCTVCHPFHEAEPWQPQLPEVGDANPVWTVVSTSQSELRWVAWSDESEEPLAAPSRFASSTLLHARFGWPPSGRPPFLAMATRDSRLEIVSLLDRGQAESEIAAAMQGLKDRDGDALNRLRALGGARLWDAHRQIERDFGGGSTAGSPVDARAGAGHRAAELLAAATPDDLRRLPWFVLAEWRRWRKEGRREPDPATARDRVVGWTLDILQRAHHFGSDTARELTPLLAERACAVVEEYFAAS